MWKDEDIKEIYNKDTPNHIIYDGLYGVPYAKSTNIHDDINNVYII